MHKSEGHFVVLPERREDLWRAMLDFLRGWRDVRRSGFDEPVLVRAEAALGCALPPVLREFYGELGGLMDAGCFDDGDNVLLRPDQCRLVKHAKGPTLVIADETHGALWGVRQDQVSLPDPPIRCIDTGREAIDGLFRCSELLVGLLFRSTVIHAPIHIRVGYEIARDDDLEGFYQELLAHFPSWDRGDGERDCGFLSHIEGSQIIASLTNDALHLGLKDKASIATLPQPLPGLLTGLWQRAG